MTLPAVRLFAGIALDADVRERCAGVAARLLDAGLDARYEAPQKYHVTLAFLGSVEATRVAECEGALAEAAGRCSVFTMAFDRVSAFPSERRPRVVWVGARAQPPEFQELALRVRNAYGSLGFRFDDGAIAHVTIARIKGGLRRPVPILDVEPFALGVREIVLFESVTSGQTTSYAIRARHCLGRSGQ